MPFAINIFNIKQDTIMNNGNFDIGPTIQNSHTANNKLVGSNYAFGDLSLAISNHANGYFDPDISDQGQVANPSAPFAGQF